MITDIHTMKRVTVHIDPQELVRLFSPELDLQLWDVRCISNGSIRLVFGREDRRDRITGQET